MAKKTTRAHRPVEVLTAAEVLRLLRACPRRTPCGARLAALVALLYGSGLRIAEALELRPADVDLAGGRVRVNNGKGGKAGWSALLPEATPWLERWLDRRKALGIRGAAAPLFCSVTSGKVAAPSGRTGAPALVETKPGKPLHPEAVWRALRRAALRAGLEGRRVHPHALRHSHARALIEAGWSLEEVSRQLRHSQVTITNTYLRGLGSDAVIERMKSTTFGLEAERTRAIDAAADSIVEKLRALGETEHGRKALEALGRLVEAAKAAEFTTPAAGKPERKRGAGA